MDYATAHKLIIAQGLTPEQTPDALLPRLQQGQPPVPGQVTTLLLALKVLADADPTAPTIERQLASALHLLATESRHRFEQGRRQGVTWPPLLDEDITRIGQAVKRIFLGTQPPTAT